MKISEIDKNFAPKLVERENYTYTDYRELTLEGFPWFSEDNELLRLPKRLFGGLRETLVQTSYSCAGGVLRFKTDSPKIAVHCKLRNMRNSSGMPLASDAGIDLYCKKSFLGNCRPEPGEDEFDTEIDVSLEGMNTFTLYFPLYSGISELHIGTLNGYSVSPAKRENDTPPIVFYGSSVTNGGCAARPGLTYPSIITRDFDIPQINLGFSGNAKGEIEIAKEIAKLNVSAVVMEYDHNANSPEYLKDTHKPFFDELRKGLPHIPIIIVSRPDFYCIYTKFSEEMKKIVKATFDQAVKDGDKNVYFVDGTKFFPKENASDYSADLIHPNDRGFAVMAEKIETIISDCRKSRSTAGK